MTQEECLKLAKILARRNSPFAGERDAAERLANAFLAKHRHPAPAVAPTTAPAIAHAALPAPYGTERRRSRGGAWRGYCRRRRTIPGRALNIAA